jgi:hypothetical protein
MAIIHTQTKLAAKERENKHARLWNCGKCVVALVVSKETWMVQTFIFFLFLFFLGHFHVFERFNSNLSTGLFL